MVMFPKVLSCKVCSFLQRLAEIIRDSAESFAGDELELLDPSFLFLFFASLEQLPRIWLTKALSDEI